MNFLEAVKAMKEGKKVTRPDWSGYIYVKNRRIYHRDGEFRNTAINQFEATDWEIDDLDFDTLFKKIIPYARREGLNYLADAMDRKGFWNRLIEKQCDNQDIEDLEEDLKKSKEKDMKLEEKREIQINNFYNLLFDSARHLKNIDKTLKDIAAVSYTHLTLPTILLV